MLTANQLLKAANLKTRMTLVRWHQLGLIPPPVVQTHPRGRGRIGYWDDAVLNRVLRIRELRQLGYSIEEIRQKLSSQRQTKRRTYVFSEISEKMDFDAAVREFAAAVREKTFPLMRKLTFDARQFLRSLDDATHNRASVHKAIALANGNKDPVLIITGNAPAVVVPGGSVAALLSEGKPMLAVPIAAEVVAAFSRTVPTLATKASGLGRRRGRGDSRSS